MDEPESRYYHSQRLRLHYAVWGSDDNPPLVLVHGSRDHARSWDFVAEALADRFQVFAPDLRGHGDSDWAVGSQYSIIEYVVDLARLVEIIGGPVAMVGHSLGGGVVLEYAGTMPERVTKAVSIEGLGRWHGFGHRPANVRMREYINNAWDLEGRQPRAYATLQEAAARMQEANRHLTPALAMHLTRHGVRRREDGRYVWKYDNFTRMRGPYEWNTEDAHAIWAAITAPVLFIAGAESQGGAGGWAQARRSHEAAEPSGEAFKPPADAWRGRGRMPRELEVFQDLRAVTIEGAGHWVHHDQFDRFVAVTREFLLA